MPGNTGKPWLLVDVDGVISLFGFAMNEQPPGRWLLVDGIAHLLSRTAGEHLRELASAFELVWCTGWQERANDYLPHALGLDAPLPFVDFDAIPRVASHWKLAAIDAHAGAERSLAWIDDAHDDACATWAAERAGATLLVRTEPAAGLTGEHVALLLSWAGGRGARRAPPDRAAPRSPPANAR